MKKRDREQLRASIAKDLVQGQGAHSPTKELLKQYAPLEGIISTPGPSVSRRPGSGQPVEKLLGTTCHRGTETASSMARCHRGASRDRSIRCHRGTICHGQGRAAGAEYDQLQHLSDAQSFRQAGLLPALSSVAWLPA